MARQYIGRRYIVRREQTHDDAKSEAALYDAIRRLVFSEPLRAYLNDVGAAAVNGYNSRKSNLDRDFVPLDPLKTHPADMLFIKYNAETERLDAECLKKLTGLRAAVSDLYARGLCSKPNESISAANLATVVNRMPGIYDIDHGYAQNLEEAIKGLESEALPDSLRRLITAVDTAARETAFYSMVKSALSQSQSSRGK